MPNLASPVRVESKPNSILFVGCPPAERAATERELASVNAVALWADSPGSACAQLQRQNMPVLIDFSSPAVAVQLIREIRQQRTDVLAFAVIPANRPDLATEAVVAGMADVLVWPIDGRRIANAVQRELAYRSGRLETDACHHDLYAQSAAMQGVVEQIGQAAKRRGGVLIVGEEGTGKEAVARAIHAVDPASRQGRFVVIDCAGLEAAELTTLLFGIPARADEDDLPARSVERISTDSRLHEAIGGTLYLRNLAEAPTRVQIRLACMLRDREVTIVESGATVPLNMRCIASADPGIETAVRDGRLRDDLFRRVSGFRIAVPRLADRRQDIPALANAIAREICASRNTSSKVLSRAALSLFAALPWRGNASELRAVLASAIAGSDTSIVRLETVLVHVRLDGNTVMASAGTLRQARTRFEREYISAILAQHRGRITEAAKVLGIQRTNLYRKMRSLSVSRERRS
jgi:DNA-binding NtrC family response regulator